MLLIVKILIGKNIFLDLPPFYRALFYSASLNHFSRRFTVRGVFRTLLEFNNGAFLCENHFKSWKVLKNIEKISEKLRPYSPYHLGSLHCK